MLSKGKHTHTQRHIYTHIFSNCHIFWLICWLLFGRCIYFLNSKNKTHVLIKLCAYYNSNNKKFTTITTKWRSNDRCRTTILSFTWNEFVAIMLKHGISQKDTEKVCFLFIFALSLCLSLYISLLSLISLNYCCMCVVSPTS